MVAVFEVRLDQVVRFPAHAGRFGFRGFDEDDVVDVVGRVFGRLVALGVRRGNDLERIVGFFHRIGVHLPVAVDVSVHFLAGVERDDDVTEFLIFGFLGFGAGDDAEQNEGSADCGEKRFHSRLF